MSYECIVDRSRRVVRIIVRGDLTRTVIVEIARDISSDARICDDFDHFIDLRDASSAQLTSQDVAGFASANFGSGARQAIVARDQVTYGLARMFQTYRDTHRTAAGRVGVFRDAAEAESWLAEAERVSA